MAIVSVALVLSFHLKHQPSAIELRMAKPLGAIFWALSVACLGVGVANYIRESYLSGEGEGGGGDGCGERWADKVG